MSIKTACLMLLEWPQTPETVSGRLSPIFHCHYIVRYMTIDSSAQRSQQLGVSIMVINGNSSVELMPVP